MNSRATLHEVLSPLQFCCSPPLEPPSASLQALPVAPQSSSSKERISSARLLWVAAGGANTKRLVTEVGGVCTCYTNSHVAECDDTSNARASIFAQSRASTSNAS
eukprot:2900676-Amphidinium_carterae.1